MRMRKGKLIIGTTAMLVFVSILCTTNVMAIEEDTEDDTQINVIVLSESDVYSMFNLTSGGDLNAYLNGVASGDINYWIDGIEVSGEFINIWASIDNLYDNVDSAQKSAGLAFLYATDNSQRLRDHSQELQMHNDTLNFQYGVINETYTNLYLLRDEVVAFEGHYVSFENKTNNTLLGHSDDLQALRAQLDDLNGVVALMRNFLIGCGLALAAIYIVNRRYPLGQYLNNKDPSKNTTLSKPSKSPQKAKAKSEIKNKKKPVKASKKVKDKVPQST